MNVQQLERLFAYDDWANHEALRSLVGAGAPARALRWMAHIIAAQWLWMARLQQRASPMAVWPELQIAECESQLAELRGRWRDYLGGLHDGKLSAPISYVNSKGEPWSNTVADILMHVVMHGVYHRGQIAAQVRASGHAPAYTDFIECVRRGYLGG